MKLGDILKELLDLRSMTQKQLAENLDLSPSALGNYIQGTRAPDYATLIRIADFFHVTTDYLLNHPVAANTPGKEAAHREELLLHIFRSRQPNSKNSIRNRGRSFYIKIGKKESSNFPLGKEIKGEAS